VPVNPDSLKPVHVFALGVCALCAQAIFIREMLALFTGTELVIGLLLAGWLFWVGAGGLLGGRLVRRGSRFARFDLFAVSAALLVPATTLLIRTGRGVIAGTPGALPPFVPALVLSLLAIAPFGFVYGTLYNIASSLWRRGPGGIGGGISRVYIWEAAGSLAGAALFSYALLPLLSQFQASLAIACIVMVVVVLPFSGLRPNVIHMSLVALFIAVCILFGPSLDRFSIRSIYSGYSVERFHSSRYGELVVASRQESTSFFSSGSRLFSVPEPERTEEITHIPMLLHPEPRDVLMIGGSLGGGWEEVAKHPSVRRITCLELDGDLIELVGESDWHTPATEDSVLLQPGDGRFFIRTTADRFDVIILRAPPPTNLQWNRYYTREFFEAAALALRSGGILALTHPSSENYLSPEQLRVLRTLERTLGGVFSNVLVLPGTTTHFCASDTALDEERILVRLEQRGISTRFINEDFLPHRLSPGRKEFLTTGMQSAGEMPVNSDMRPVLPLYELALEGERAGSRFMILFGKLSGTPAWLPPAVVAAILAVLFIVVPGKGAATLCIWSVGFCSLLLQLLLLLAYQSFSGHLYHTIVLMTALFMGGMAIGAWCSHTFSRAGRGIFRFVHLCFAVLALSTAAWVRPDVTSGLPLVTGTVLFLVCTCCAGFLTGFYYPAVVRSAPPADRAPPALYYAWDLFGACAGGILGGLILFPVTGIVGTALLIALIHIAAAAFSAGRWG
jgi:spermidine synthase